MISAISSHTFTQVTGPQSQSPNSRQQIVPVWLYCWYLSSQQPDKHTKINSMVLCLWGNSWKYTQAQFIATVLYNSTGKRYRLHQVIVKYYNCGYRIRSKQNELTREMALLTRTWWWNFRVLYRKITQCSKNGVGEQGTNNKFNSWQKQPRPDRICSPPSLFSQRYRELFPRDKAARPWS
jgi:hypothetical protein